MDQYYVIGNPIEHSMSPLIHAQFSKQTKQNMNYDRLLVPIGKFNQTIDQLKADHVCGVNITLPFKQEAMSYADALTGRAQISGAVNTLTFNHGSFVLGDNTDGLGLVSDITSRLHWDLNHQDILILGAGGAVRGILDSLLLCNPKSITIANRTVDKANALANQYDQVTGCALHQLKDAYPIIINAIPFGINAAIDPLTLPHSIIETQSHCYDLCYTLGGPTPWNTWCKAHGAQQTSDGLGMLIEQAAEAFYIWRDVKPNTQTVYAQLRP